MTAQLRGPLKWSLDTDEDGYRNYTVTHLVVTTSKADGPLIISRCPGLPRYGSVWDIGNDYDGNAYCTAGMKVTPRITGEPNFWWEVEQKFTTKPIARDLGTPKNIGNPLLEPAKVSGSFTRYSEKIRFDADSLPILSSSFDPIMVERDNSYPNVRIEQNVGSLQLASFCAMINCVNSSAMWGLPARCVKLSNASWEQKTYGRSYTYYTRSFEFDISYVTWDLIVADYGHRALWGHNDKGTWVIDKIDGADPDPTKPTHFRQYMDAANNPANCFLNGAGVPVTSIEDAAAKTVKRYPTANFFSLGVPVSF